MRAAQARAAAMIPGWSGAFNQLRGVRRASPTRSLRSSSHWNCFIGAAVRMTRSSGPPSPSVPAAVAAVLGAYILSIQSVHSVVVVLVAAAAAAATAPLPPWPETGVGVERQKLRLKNLYPWIQGNRLKDEFVLSQSQQNLSKRRIRLSSFERRIRLFAITLVAKRRGEAHGVTMINDASNGNF